MNIILPKNNEDIPRFQTIEPDSPDRKWKCLSKKRLKEKRMREKKKRREMNKRDPRKVIVPKGMRKKGKNKFANAGERIKYRIEKAKIKEAMLIKKLEKYEVAKLQGPMPKPENLTGEERFYMQKMGQKKSNYVPVGRKGVFGGVILNMHLHWKKHETVKVICKPCKPGQVHEYTKEIARLSGGEPIQIIGNDTILFYRGKDYVQPQVLSPIDTLSKKKALEKSKYEQSLESVRNLITVSEKELELYYRHVALYGDHKPSTSDLVHGDKEDKQSSMETLDSKNKENVKSFSDATDTSTDISDVETNSDSENDTEAENDTGNVLEAENEYDSKLSGVETDSENEELSEDEIDAGELNTRMLNN